MKNLSRSPIETKRLHLIERANASILLARRRLLKFCKFFDKAYETPKHVQVVSSYLEKVERGEIKRLMISMPPRHGKSELVSRKFPAWFLGRNPDKNVIIASYAKSLCRGFSRKNRELVENPDFKLVFPNIETADDSRSADNWELKNHKGGLVAAGIGGGLTGVGAHLFIIDDPIKDRQEAESQVFRDRAFDWYQNVALTRLEPNAAMILQMTRWHQDDPAGRILKNEKGWVVINLPAIIENDAQAKNDLLERRVGDLLWPGRYSHEAMEAIKHNSGSRAWSALYQGEPMDAASQVIRRDWIRWYEKLPPDTSRAGGIDVATSQKTTADNTAFCEVAKDQEGFIYVDDLFCEQVSVNAFKDFYVNRVKTQRFQSVKIEENAAGEAMRQVIVGECQKQGASPHPQGFRTSTDKVIRVMEFVAMIENGTIRFKRGHRKIEQLVEHLIDFPQCVHDDDIDALGFAIKAILAGAGVNIRFI